MSEIIESINFSGKNQQEHDEVEAYFRTFPTGYRFNPTDEELILCYLKPKLLNLRLPPNKIIDVELYCFSPDKLVEMYKSYGEGEWYYFTPREKKYPNGRRPRRSAGGGYWKATGADKTVEFEGTEIGYRKALVFYAGKAPKGEKTDWMMHEFRLKDPPVRTEPSPHAMRLDDWVLCKIYKKTDRANRSGELGVVAALDGLGSFEDDMMLVDSTSPFLDDIGYHYNQIFMPDQSTVAPPSPTKPSAPN